MERNRGSLTHCILLAIVTVLIPMTSAFGQIEKVLYTFSGGNDGATPSGMVMDAKGNLFGTTYIGGTNFGGTVFELSPNADGTWSISEIYSFSFSNGEGYLPSSGLVFDSAGDLYGTASGGGSSSLGTVYELSPGSGGTWTERTLYSFTNGSDGTPSYGSTLSIDSSGSLYGIADGGVFGFGNVYELVAGSNGTWAHKILHSFTGGNDGAYVDGQQLMFDSAGNVYGSTGEGGAHDYGLVFELVKGAHGSWSEQVLYSFSGGADGSAGLGNLMFDAAENLYGHSDYDVLELKPGSNGAWTKTVLHTFVGGSDGANPATALIFDKAGHLYGMTNTGGQHRGTVFELIHQPDGTWSEKILYRFKSSGGDGAFPLYFGLMMDANGNLYGTTQRGGNANFGVVFEVTP